MTSEPAAMPHPSTGRHITTGIPHHIRRALLTALLLTGMAAAALPVPGAAASPSFTFNAAILGSCVSVHGPASTSITVNWRTASGMLNARFTEVSNGSGWVTGPQPCTSGPAVNSGDRITATAGTASRTFTVPVLTVAFDRVGYHVSGRGPAGSQLSVKAGRHGSFVGPNGTCTTTTTVHASGHYSVNVQGIPGGPVCPPDYTPTGGDTATVIWSSGHLDTVYRSVRAQQVVITQGGSSISGSVAPGRTVHIVVRNSAGAVRGTAHGTADALGSFVIVVRNSTGHSVHVRAGDHVSGDWAGNVSLIVPDMRLQTIALLHQVTGWCMPNAPYDLKVGGASGEIGQTSVTDANGRTKPLIATGHMISGETISLTCAFHKGDLVTFSERVS